jgi:hypothetical protein
MSMNLEFRTVQGNHRVPFPFQTSTDLTYAVMNAESVEQQIALIECDVIAWSWDQVSINRLIDDCERLLRDPTLKLGMV